MQFKKALSRAASVLVFLIFAAGLFVFTTVMLSKKDGVPNFLGYSFLSVSTRSMESVYPVGTVVIAKKVAAEELAKGDIISFFSEDPAIYGIPNTHRIVSVNKNDSGETYFVTKGDNNPTADIYPVYSEKVIGKAQGSIGSLGNIINKLQNRYILFFLLIVPLALIVVFELRNITKLLKRGDESKKPESPPESKDKTDGG